MILSFFHISTCTLICLSLFLHMTAAGYTGIYVVSPYEIFFSIMVLRLTEFNSLSTIYTADEAAV